MPVRSLVVTKMNRATNYVGVSYNSSDHLDEPLGRVLARPRQGLGLGA